MDNQKRLIAERIRGDLLELARLVSDEQYKVQPELWERYGERGYQKCVEDTQAHLAYFAEAVALGDTSLFIDYVRWAGEMLQAFGVPPDIFAANLQATRVVLQGRFSSEEVVMLSPFIDAGLAILFGKLQTHQSYLDSRTPLAALANDYLQALLHADRHAARTLIMDAVSSGTSIKDVYLNIFQPVQYELGRLWQTNVISVAQEHYCTAETQRMMSRLSLYFPSTPRNGRAVVTACIGGEFHDIGIRMVSDFFEMAGWETFYLGANTPLRGLLPRLSELRPDVFALSATITAHLDKVGEIIQAVHARDDLKSLKIMVGGYPFNVAPRLWHEIGADGYAQNGDSAVEVASSLVAK